MSILILKKWIWVIIFDFDISIEPVTQIVISKEKVNIDGENNLVKDIMNKSCRIFPSMWQKVSNEVTIHNVFDDGDKIMV